MTPNLNGATTTTKMDHPQDIRKDDKIQDMEEDITSLPQNETPDAAEHRNAANMVQGAHILPGMTKEYTGWDVYNNEAMKVDTELVKDWITSLNFLLIFAAIFAAVLTPFTIESKKLLEPDPAKVMVDVMIFFTNNADNVTRPTYTQDVFIASPSNIAINCFFFTSLSASIIAALASVVALQWVADYDASITRGGSSPEDRAKRRQFRYEGVLWWKMGEIIAALPLLLYSSVVLFFIGLFIWMYSINHIVGLVVMVGAAIASLFYGLSTFLGVACVSAPFRTPLTKWIYSLSLLPFSASYLLIKKVIGASTIPSWLETRHQLYTTSNKREDRAIEKRRFICKDALEWLATQLSISPDSHRRLLLLAEELSRLNPGQFQSFISIDKPWYSIFDLLGWIYLSSTQEGCPTAEDRRAITVLQRCNALSEIRQLISPSPKAGYVTDINDMVYWSQNCTQAGTWRFNPNAPNHLFLLLRDIPPSPNYSDVETDAIIRLSRWRNSKSKLAEDLNEVFAQAIHFHPRFFSSLVVVFSNYTRYCGRSAWLRDWLGDHESNLTAQTETAMQLLHIVEANRDLLLPHAALPLIRSFEAGLLGKVPRESSPFCLELPLNYSRLIHKGTPEQKAAHDRIPLILSRLLESHPATELVSRVREVILMLWIRAKDTEVQQQDFIKENPVSSNAQWNICGDVSVDWVKDADSAPHIREILHHLAAIQSQHPYIGPLWRTTRSNSANNPNFIEALQTMDCLMGEGCTSDQHCTLVEPVCQDIELEQAPEFDGYFTKERLQAIAQLHDPCLRLVAECAGGIEPSTLDILIKESHGVMKSSWDRIAQHLMVKYPRSYSSSILQLQALLLPQFSGRRKMCEEALREPEVLAHLQRMFNFPVNRAIYYDGLGQLLEHLFNKMGICLSVI